MGLVKNAGQLYAVRFLLGIFEGSAQVPGIEFKSPAEQKGF